jgi:hypothetical protein
MLRWVVILGLAAALAGGQDEHKRLTGIDWLKLSSGQRVGYAAGFRDGYVSGYWDAGLLPDSGLLSGSTDTQTREYVGRLSCLTKMTGMQVLSVIDKFIAEHPDRRYEMIDQTLHEAMGKACADRDAR